MNSRDYWAMRSAQDMVDRMGTAEQTAAEMNKAIQQSADYIAKEVKAFEIRLDVREKPLVILHERLLPFFVRWRRAALLYRLQCCFKRLSLSELSF